VFAVWRGSGVLAALVLCVSMSTADAFAASPLLAPRHHAGLLQPVLAAAPGQAKRQGPAALQMVAAPGPMVYQAARLPANPKKDKCACGSGLSYDRCCSQWHKKGEGPIDPILLIKSRYSAFAYNLPEYIIKTTSTEGPEYKPNLGDWEAELRDFCKTYGFKKLSGDTLGVSIEECKFWDNQRAAVLFKARMLGEDNRLIEFWERSVLVRERFSLVLHAPTSTLAHTHSAHTHTSVVTLPLPISTHRQIGRQIDKHIHTPTQTLPRNFGTWCMYRNTHTERQTRAHENTPPERWNMMQVPSLMRGPAWCPLSRTRTHMHAHVRTQGRQRLVVP
jgi:SEC-C motif domain protein